MRPLSRWITGLATAVVLTAGGCDLDVENPNAPDKERAFSDPAGLAQLLGGAFRTWVETRGNYFIMPLNAMADNYTASWNNAAIRFYSSVGVECPVRCGWSNSATSPEAAGGPTVETGWYGYYTVLSSANNVLTAIEDGLCFDDDCDADNTLTLRNGAIAKMLQGMALAGLAVMYDQGFIVDETTELPDDPTAYPEFNTREEMRDAALQKFEEAWAAADGAEWDTEAEWMGVGSGTAYTAAEIQQVIRTMQAELVAMFPRNSTENAQADWGAVAVYASEGISSTPPGFNWEYFIDAGAAECGADCIKTWGNSIGTMRVDTRLASVLATNHTHPWPEAAGGNPCPTTSPDLRVGDGSYGPWQVGADDNAFSTRPATANAGTDFACADSDIFPAARGQYHQSELAHVRYQHLAYVGENLPGSNGIGQDPFYTTQMNDLLWAEGLIRGGGDRILAADLINNSRFDRGGLTPLDGSESDAEMLDALQYEQEIEFMGQGTTPYYNKRRIDGLLQDTPLHMPVPAQEMDVLLREIYTFGGPTAPEMSVVGTGNGPAVKSVAERFREIQAMRPSMGVTRF